MRERIPFRTSGRNDLILSLPAIGRIPALAFCGSARARDVLADRLALDLRYHDTDAHDFGDVYESRAVSSLKATF